MLRFTGAAHSPHLGYHPVPHSPADAPAQKLNEDPMNAPTRSNARPVVACLLAACAAAGARAADDAAIAAFSSAPPGEPPAAWKFATLPNKSPTKFTVAELDGAKVLKIEADNSRLG